jgi:formylglycine-generating enzyme required for sulfatase activity
VVGVSWDEAEAFSDWLTRKGRSDGELGPSQRYRLPTDAEWSVAVGLREASGGTPGEKSARIKNVYPWRAEAGKEWPPPNGAGNYSPTLHCDSFEQTSPVGSFPANQYGLHDMGGNAWQWCEDWFDETQRVLRGAAWTSEASESILSSYRLGGWPNKQHAAYGFRVVLEIEVPPP